MLRFEPFDPNSSRDAFAVPERKSHFRTVDAEITKLES